MRLAVLASFAAIFAGSGIVQEARAQAPDGGPVVVLQFQPAYPYDPAPAPAVYERVLGRLSAGLGGRLLAGPSLAAELRDGMAACSAVPACTGWVRERFRPAVLVTGVVGREPDGSVRGRVVATGPDGRELGVIDRRFPPGAEDQLGQPLAALLQQLVGPPPAAAGTPTDPYGAPAADPYASAAAPYASAAAPYASAAPSGYATASPAPQVPPASDPYGTPPVGPAHSGTPGADSGASAATASGAESTVRPTPAPPAAASETRVEAAAAPRRTARDVRGFYLRAGLGYALGALRQLYGSAVYVDGSQARVDQLNWGSIDFQAYGASAFLGFGYGVNSHVEVGLDLGLLVGQNSFHTEYATASDPDGTIGNDDWDDHAALFGLVDPRVRFYLVPEARARASRFNAYVGVGVPFVITAPFKVTDSVVVDEASGDTLGQGRYFDDRPAGLLFGPELAAGLRVAAGDRTALLIDVPVAFLLVDSGFVSVEDFDAGAEDRLHAPSTADPESFRILVRFQAALQFLL